MDINFTMQKILSYLSCHLAFNDETTYRRAIVINGALLISSIFFTFFAFFNFFILHRENIVFLNLSALLISSILLVYIKKTKNINITAQLSTIALSLFLLLFVNYAHSDHFALIWTIFLPIYAFFVNGKKRGLYFSLLFYSILFIMSYKGIGVWDEGDWTMIDWTRLFLASLLILFAVYLNESAYEKYEKRLKLSRSNEKKLIEKLSQLSITDPLTKLYNRRYYDEIIEKMIAVAKRNKQCIHFFILDLDFFKNYNDYYGHEKGDEILSTVAQLLKKNIQRRGDDFVFRLGGEEFAGILISEDKEKAQKWIAEITHKVEALQLKHKKSLCCDVVTVSIGICSRCANEEFNAKELYLSADKALYEAKLQGRNQCRVAS